VGALFAEEDLGSFEGLGGLDLLVVEDIVGWAGER